MTYKPQAAVRKPPVSGCKVWVGETVFSYGTLQAQAIMQRLIGRIPTAEPACLLGFCRYRLRNQAYPGLKPKVLGQTSGLLYYGLRPWELHRLDAYEGQEYQRVLRWVSPTNGRRRRVWVYLLKRPYGPGLSRQTWCLAEFQTQHLAEYLSHLPRWL